MSNPEMCAAESGFKYGCHKTKMDQGVICIKIKWAEVWTGWEWELLHMQWVPINRHQKFAPVWGRSSQPPHPPQALLCRDSLQMWARSSQELWRQGSTSLRLSGIGREGNENGGIDLGFWSVDIGWEKRMELYIRVFKGWMMCEALLWVCGTTGMRPPNIQSQKLFPINNYKSFSLPCFWINIILFSLHKLAGY